ncbi:MAG: comEA [Firmicutes bacterium]|nr:comEA [Bacillota bacterium]
MTEDGKKRLVFILVLAILIVGGSFYFYDQKSKVNEVTMSPPSSSDLIVSSTQSEKDEIVVYISGAVNKPGILRVPAGSRVVDVVDAAGGLAPGADPSKVNLAKVVKDGTHVNVPIGKLVTDKKIGTAVNSSSGQSQTSSKRSSSGGEMVNINSADKNELDKLPGIGPSLADRIVEYRQENGSFRDLSELKNVAGIGETKFNQIKDKLSL